MHPTVLDRFAHGYGSTDEEMLALDGRSKASMEIVFMKLAGNRHEIVVWGCTGPDAKLPARETGPSIPHDLAHAVVEKALVFEDEVLRHPLQMPAG